MKSCFARDPKVRPAASTIVEYLANAPRLLNPCMDVPLQSITLDDGDGRDGLDHDFTISKVDMRKSSTNSNFNSPKSQFNFGGRSLVTGDTTDQDESVSIQLENYCPRAPLLGTSKSNNSLISFGKFNMQSNRRDSGCQAGEDESLANVPANGYVNSKL